MTTLAGAPAPSFSSSLSLSSAGSPSAAARARLRERVARVYADRTHAADAAPSTNVTSD